MGARARDGDQLPGVLSDETGCRSGLEPLRAPIGQVGRGRHPHPGAAVGLQDGLAGRRRTGRRRTGRQHRPVGDGSGHGRGRGHGRTGEHGTPGDPASLDRIRDLASEVGDELGGR